MTPQQTDPDADDLEHRYIYDVILCVEHPTEPPERITRELGLAPDEPTFSVGVAIWSHSVKIRDHRLFFKVVVALLTQLEAAADFVHTLNAAEGRLTIWLRLPGHTNIGDVLAPGDVMRMARLKVELGVDVIPDLRSEPALRRPYPRAQPGPASA